MYNQFISRLVPICNKIGLIPNIIGYTGKNKEYPIFSVILNNNSNNAVCFSAGIHGDEISGPLSILEFLKNYDSIHKDIKIILLPVANPHGFDKKERRNFLDKDLNRHFYDRKLSNENKILYESIKNENLILFHALHEDFEENNFYLYNFEKKEEKIYRDIIAFAKNYFTIKDNSGIITNEIDGSFEDRLFRDGVPFSMCTETPGKASLEKRIAFNLELINKVIEFVNKSANLLPIFIK